MRAQSLAAYLNRRYLLLMALLFLFAIAFMSLMNWSGMDDTTEYYMQYEAQVLSEFYPPYSSIDEFDLGKKEYYWGRKQLPRRYSELIKDQPAPVNQATLYITEQSYVYLLPYPLPDGDILFYVVHIFEQDTTFHPFAKNALIGGFSLSFILLLLLVFSINHRATTVLQSFAGWMKKVSDNSATGQSDIAAPSELRFGELIQASEHIQAWRQLVDSEQLRLKREQDFLASLSHELNTPLSVIRTAIALLKKQQTMSDKQRAIVDKIAKANDKMVSLSASLLQVWRRQPSHVAAEPLLVSELVSELIEHDLSHNEPLRFHIKIRNEKTIVADRTLLTLALSNLLRNACQYGENDIEVEIDVRCIRITNRCSQEVNEHTTDYGFGLGLYLVERLCEQQQWELVVQGQQGRFSVALNL